MKIPNKMSFYSDGIVEGDIFVITDSKGNEYKRLVNEVQDSVTCSTFKFTWYNRVRISVRLFTRKIWNWVKAS